MIIIEIKCVLHMIQIVIKFCYTSLVFSFNAFGLIYASRGFCCIIELPPEADIETARCAYNNGILEITFNKKEQAKTKGRQ